MTGASLFRTQILSVSNNFKGCRGTGYRTISVTKRERSEYSIQGLISNLGLDLDGHDDRAAGMLAYATVIVTYC
jgi:hypothetical protein